MVSKVEIERELDGVLSNWLRKHENKDIVPGWRHLVGSGFSGNKIEGIVVPNPSIDVVGELIELAEGEASAFDALSYVAGMRLAANMELENELRLFAAKVLSGEVARPTKRGRRENQDVVLRAYLFGLAKFIESAASIPLTRNDLSDTYSACDAVAQSLTRCGKAFSYEQMRSICRDRAYRDVRKLGQFISGKV